MSFKKPENVAGFLAISLRGSGGNIVKQVTKVKLHSTGRESDSPSQWEEQQRL